MGGCVVVVVAVVAAVVVVAGGVVVVADDASSSEEPQLTVARNPIARADRPGVPLFAKRRLARKITDGLSRQPIKVRN